MENLFERKYYMRTSDFDRFGCVQPSAVLDLFQDVAGLHANALGCGYDDLIQKQMIWVLVRVKFELIKSPVMFQQVTVKTWPLEPSRAGFRRDYLIEDEAGAVLVRGASEWVVVHSELRRMVPARDVYPEMSFITETAVDEKLSKLREIKEDGQKFDLIPRFSDIDINGHVNNTKYANFVLNALSPEKDERIKALQIDYRHEVREGVPLTLKLGREDNAVTAFGADTEDNTMFACRIEFC